MKKVVKIKGGGPEVAVDSKMAKFLIATVQVNLMPIPWREATQIA